MRHSSIGAILVEIPNKEVFVVIMLLGTLHYGKRTKTEITVRTKEIR